MEVKVSYPADSRDRDRWVRSRRPALPRVDPRQPPLPSLEQERDVSGHPATVATVFLVNRECPWRCVMCDLWRYALPESVPPGAIPAQLSLALARLDASAGLALDPALPPATKPTVLKLYNAGSFFDAAAIPPADYPALAEQVSGFDRVIVECHPALVGERVREFQGLLRPGTRLEVAMGLETADPEILPRLNKRMTLAQFRAAAQLLHSADVDLRVFILVKPPFQRSEAAAVDWAVRSVEFAAECGAGVAVLIPTRAGNGAMETLAAEGDFQPPRLAALEQALTRSLASTPARLRVFADLWDLERFSECPACLGLRRGRLERMNLSQMVLPELACPTCGGAGVRAGSANPASSAGPVRDGETPP